MENIQLTDISQDSFLHATFELILSAKCPSLKLQKGGPVAVIAIQRYLAELTYEQQQQQQHQQADSYSYDVTLTDGVWRAKCFLDPSLNHLVHKNILRSGTDVHITECSFVHSEKRLGHAFICIMNMKCGSSKSEILTRAKDVNSLPLLTRLGSGNVMAWRNDVPLRVGRKHYLALWNNEDPEVGAFTAQGPPSHVVLDVSNITLLCDLESSFRNKSRRCPLLVRVLHKSRLRYYGKFGLQIDFPYQAYFEVADQSGIMSLVLWNELCPEWYQRLNVGTVLYLQNYTVKSSYSARSRPQMDHHRLKTFDSVEICLNPWNPASVITVVSPKYVQSQWALPEIAYKFTTRSEVENLAHNTACDVIGLVTFVGRVERVKNKEGMGPEKYWNYRWVHAVDGTSNHPFILEIFASSQPEIFNSICPMAYLVCTQMRMCKVEGSSPYLTSSCETELFITGYHKGQPYVSDPKVKSFIQWTKTLKDSVMLGRTCVGGHFCFPHAPQVFTQSTADGSAQVPLVATAELKRELESLQYREHKRLAIQGQITAVRYLRLTQTSAESDQEQGSDLSAGVSDEAAPNLAELILPSSKTLSTSSPKKKLKRRVIKKSYITRTKKRAKGPAGHDNTEDEEEEEENTFESEEVQEEDCLHQGNLNQVTLAEPPVDPDRDRLSWESSAWPEQKREVSQHLCPGGLYPESLSQRYTLDDRDCLLLWSNLHPARWTPEHSEVSSPPADSPGYYQITILGINKQMAIDAAFFPVVSSGDPRAVGLPQGPHGNTLLSCLTAGFLCPLSDPDSLSETVLPQPEEVLGTAEELEDAHLVCILDLCHLGGDKVEVLINKVYRETDIALV